LSPSVFHNLTPFGEVSTNPSLAVSSTFDPFGAGVSPLAYHTTVFSEILGYQIESKKRLVSLSGRKPKAKSPEGESNHGDVLACAVKESPMAMVLLV
jgi:hypothetical protein